MRVGRLRFTIHAYQGRSERFRGTIGEDVMATTTQWAHEKELDTKKRSSASRQFEEALREKIVGQDEAVEALVRE